MRIMRHGGQSVTEYAIVFSVVAAAILGMQIFVKRGLQAKAKDVVKHFTDVTGGENIGTTTQYEPYYAKSAYNVTQGSNVNDKVESGGKVTRTVNKEDTARTGSMTTDVNLGADDSWQ